MGAGYVTGQDEEDSGEFQGLSQGESSHLIVWQVHPNATTTD